MDRQARSIPLTEYARQVEPTDRLPLEDSQPVLLGLFGEVGSIMATAKKLHREGTAFAGYRHAVIEEFGDALWYLTAVCRRLKIGVDTVFSEAVATGRFAGALVASDMPEWPIATANRAESVPGLDAALLKLGEAAAALLAMSSKNSDAKVALVSFADCYLKSLQAAGMTFGKPPASE